jgi:hypothetical protein
MIVKAMAVSNLSLIKSDEYWDNVWSELDKKEQVLQSQVVSSVKKEKVEAVEVSALEILPINNNDLEHEVDIPKEWREVITSLTNMQQPKIISSMKWYSLRQVLAYLFSQEYALLKSIIAHDWMISDIFGCDKNAPDRVFYNAGLVMLMKETDRLGNISDKAIFIRNSRGTITSYGRPYINARNNQVLIYELF